MGMEVEVHRAVQLPGGSMVETGDSIVLEHPYFRLVTDKRTASGGVKYSNLEFVMKHFDQLAGTEDKAVDELQKRLAAMKSLRTELYAREGRLTDVVRGVGEKPGDSYRPTPVEGRPATDLLIRGAPGGDDDKLYVHYTVGFPPADWFAMLGAVHQATRADSGQSRPKTHAGHAIEVAPAIVAGLKDATVTAAVEQELHGHLALLYTQLAVFVDRTLDLQRTELERAARGRWLVKFDALQDRIGGLTRWLRANPAEGPVRREQLRKRGALIRERNALGRGQGSTLARVRAQERFVSGQPKNKVAALPRAALAQAYGVLSDPAKRFLSTNQDKIITEFATKLEAAHGVDLGEGYELVSATGEKATMGQYVTAGLDGGKTISQQVLFGGMNEVGIDRSRPGSPLLPFEFRSIFEQRVAWAELEAHAVKVLQWSRDPKHKTLT
jgi:hypothetical protein